MYSAIVFQMHQKKEVILKDTELCFPRYRWKEGGSVRKEGGSPHALHVRDCRGSVRKEGGHWFDSFENPSIMG
jgi:hypothetical protein